jgi:hypothetical protein
MILQTLFESCRKTCKSSICNYTTFYFDCILFRKLHFCCTLSHPSCFLLSQHQCYLLLMNELVDIPHLHSLQHHILFKPVNSKTIA